MKKYVELKNNIVKKMYQVEIKSDEDIVSAYDVVKNLEVDLHELKKVQKYKNKIESLENSINVIEYMIMKIKHQRLEGIDNISLSLESKNGLSSVMVSYHINLNEIVNINICKDKNDLIYFDMDESVDTRYLHHTRKILVKYDNEFKQIFSLLSKYSTKYDCDIFNESFTLEKDRLLIQHVTDEVFNIDIYVGPNFDIDCKFSIDREKDPDSMFSKDINNYINLNDMVNNNLEYILKRISISRDDLNPIIEINNDTKKVKRI